MAAAHVVTVSRVAVLPDLAGGALGRMALKTWAHRADMGGGFRFGHLAVSVSLD